MPIKFLVLNRAERNQVDLYPLLVDETPKADEIWLRLQMEKVFLDKRNEVNRISGNRVSLLAG